MIGGYCTQEQLGQFILNLPNGTSLNDTSFWSARVELPGNNTVPPADSPGRRTSKHLRQATAANPSQVLTYTEPIHYPVAKTGYYCIGKFIISAMETRISGLSFLQAVIPVTFQSPLTRRADTGAPLHPLYQGSVLFQNTFDGQLPATDYPKVNVNLFLWFWRKTILTV